jgi:hypothetical protein
MPTWQLKIAIQDRMKNDVSAVKNDIEGKTENSISAMSAW